MFIVCRDKAFQYFHSIMMVVGNALIAATILPSENVFIYKYNFIILD